MSLWTEIRNGVRKVAEDVVNPSHLVSDLNNLVGWEKPGDGPNINVRVGASTPIIDDKTQQAINTTAYMENGGYDMLGSNTAYNEEQNNGSWWDRNKDWVVPTLTTIGTTAAGMIYNNYQQKKANNFSAEQAQINRDYQTEMSNTAHQREYADLLATGLNPVNTATGGGGATTPSGGAGTSTAPAYLDHSSMANTALSLAETMKVLNENKYISAEKKAQIGNTASDTVLKQTQTEQTKAQTNEIKAQTEFIQKQYDLLSLQEKRELAEMIGMWDKAKSEAEKAKVEAWMNSTWLGKFAHGAGMTISNLMPILGPIGRFSTK